MTILRTKRADRRRRNRWARTSSNVRALFCADRHARAAAPTLARGLSKQALHQLRRWLAGTPRQAGIAAARWSRGRIGRLVRSRFGLRWSNAYAIRALRAHGIAVHLVRGRESQLSAARMKQLQRLLAQSPQDLGLEAQRWTRPLVRQLIEQRFKVRFSRQHIGRLLQPLRVRLIPVRQAARLSAPQVNQLRRALSQSPRASGIAQDVWDRASITAWFKSRLDWDVNARTLSRLLGDLEIALPGARGGRPSRLSADQLTLLREVLTHSPHAAQLTGPVWTQRLIAQFLHERFALSFQARNIHRMLARCGLSTAQRARRGGQSPLTHEHLQMLAQALSQPPEHQGFAARRWSRALVCVWLHQRFGIHYEPRSVSPLLRRHGLYLRPPREPTVHPQPVLASVSPASPSIPLALQLPPPPAH